MIDKAGTHVPTGGRGRRASIGVIVALAFVLTIVFASSAQAYVYWTSHDAGFIGRANLDGTNSDQTFIVGARAPSAVAADAQHLYWTNPNRNTNTIGRADLDGTNVTQSFITGVHSPSGVAVDAQHVYWAGGTIGRADLDGTNPDQNFITAGTALDGVAVDTQHVYWTDFTGSIGRADLDGTNVKPNFINTDFGSIGVALDAEHVYWTNYYGAGTIGRANLDGTSVKRSFITGANGPYAVAVDSQHVYWTNTDPVNTIGRANLDGTNANQYFIISTFDHNPYGVAVDGGGPVGGGREQRIVGSVDPHRTTVDDPTCFRFHAEDQSGEALRNVRVGFGGKHERTGGHGRAKICKSFDNPGARHARLTKRGFDRDRVHVKVKQAAN
jgi:virginiamycin B lyase